MSGLRTEAEYFKKYQQGQTAKKGLPLLPV